MQVTKLSLAAWRNYERVEFEFNGALTVVAGQNAQGKTNLLESIYFCAIGKSPRINKERELIKFGEPEARVKLEVMKAAGGTKIEARIYREGKKAIRINDCTISKMGDLMGKLTAIYFSPDELKLVKENPEYRRRFLNIGISQMSKPYFYSLLRYAQILEHRNKLLKTARCLEEVLPSLEIFSAQAAKEASAIVAARLKFIEKLKPHLAAMHKELTGGREEIIIEYEGAVGSEAQLFAEYERCYKKDFELRHTTVGPHRDDFKLLIGGRDVRTFGSQGQQRTATLSLKLAELEIFKEETGEYPVLLLDDVLSELDDGRKKRLLKMAEKCQTIITCTKVPAKAKAAGAQIIKIKDGQII